MNTLKLAVPFILSLALCAGAFIALYPKLSDAQSLRLCEVTHEVVLLGDDLATDILARGNYQWAVVQQPLNATNTVSMSFGGTAIVGQGYLLGTSTDNAQPNELRFGFATEMPFREVASAITDSGSTTVNVTYCL